MRSSGSRAKQKGSSFERSVCKQLSLWATRGKAEDVYWRSAMSGGRATMGGRRGKELRRQAGDISAVAAEGHALTDYFYIELKHYAKLDYESFFIKGAGKLAQFWKETIAGAEQHDKRPLLIVRQNNWPILVLLYAKDVTRLVGVIGPSTTPPRSIDVMPKGATVISVLPWEYVLSMPFMGTTQRPRRRSVTVV